MYNFFFSNNFSYKNFVQNIQINTYYKVKYYDEYKYLHFFDGKCLMIRKSSNDIYLLFQVRNKGIFLSFFASSPLLISIEKIM
jgi:hypothetical protein